MSRLTYIKINLKIVAYKLLSTVVVVCKHVCNNPVSTKQRELFLNDSRIFEKY